MEINIPLPNSYSINTYKELKNYLKQFELSIHYAQKAVENAEKEGLLISEDCYVNFEYPSLASSLRMDEEEEGGKVLRNFMNNYYEELQSVNLHIDLK